MLGHVHSGILNQSYIPSRKVEREKKANEEVRMDLRYWNCGWNKPEGKKSKGGGGGGGGVKGRTSSVI